MSLKDEVIILRNQHEIIIKENEEFLIWLKNKGYKLSYIIDNEINKMLVKREDYYLNKIINRRVNGICKHNNYDCSPGSNLMSIDEIKDYAKKKYEVF